MIILNRYNIKFRFVEELDAGFLLKLRTNLEKSKFISKTINDIELQREWIRAYKDREKKQEEYYFIAIDENNIDFATYRLYNREENSIEVGSFISIPEYNNPINVIKVDVIMKTFVFEELGFKELKFEVRKENKSVIKYHNLFKPKLINEDSLNNYYILQSESFFKNKKRFEKLF
jgi:hypothetical protein